MIGEGQYNMQERYERQCKMKPDPVQYWSSGWELHRDSPVGEVVIVQFFTMYSSFSLTFVVAILHDVVRSNHLAF